MTGGSVWDLQEKEEVLSGVVLVFLYYSLIFAFFFFSDNRILGYFIYL